MLRERLAGKAILPVPGIYDGLGARLAAEAGFEGLYLSGASIAYSRFGRPDIGLVAMNEVAETLAAIREVVELPIVVDADTGFGNALNVMRTVTVFERMGASAIQLEDQTTPKRCGHLSGKTLIGAGEMVGKIKAALDARRSDETLIVARTDAIAVEGFDVALDRAERYVEAGCDMLFVEAPQTREQLAAVAARFAARVPLLANMVEGGRTPMGTAGDLEAMGYAMVIFPGGLVRAFCHMARAYFASLHETGNNAAFADRMLDFAALQELIGTEEATATGARYDAANFEDGGPREET